MNLGADTRLYALLGRPVAHSQSPALHNRWFAQCGINGAYLALEVPRGREGQVVAAVRTLGLAGANVTAPLKGLVLEGLDDLGADARAAGAVNLLRWQEGQLIGDNTDVDGFVAALREAAPGQTFQRAVIAGAGGAARAVVVALGKMGVSSVVVMARREETAERLVKALSRQPNRPAGLRSAPIGTAAIAGADLLVDATSTRAAAVGGLAPEALAPCAVWMNLNYWDPDPPGLGGAQRAGRRVVAGDRMLLWQAALSFERWTGVPAETLVAGAAGG